MATVESMTLDRLLQLEADTVIGGHIDGAGHLILELHDGSTVDAGYMLASVPDSTTTVKGIVKLATEAETSARTDNTRAVTPAGLLATYNDLNGQISVVESDIVSLDGRLDTAEAKLALVNPSGGSSGYILRHNGTLFVAVAEQTYLYPNKERIKGSNASGTAACTTSYTNMGSSFSFTKRYSNTRLELTAIGTCWSTTGTTGAYFGIRINSVDYDVAALIANVPDFKHLAYSGVEYIATGVVSAGTYTIQGRWKAQNGSGVINNDPNDNYLFAIEEIAP